MADKDPADDGPSLELPSFGFGRKKRRDRAEGSLPEVPAAPDPGPDATPGPAPEVPASPDPGPEVNPATAPEVPAAPAPDGSPDAPPEIDPLAPSRPDDPAPRPEIEPTVPVAPPEPEPAAPEIDPLVPTRPESQPEPTDREARTTRGPVRLPSLPSLPALPAVLLVGAVVGLVAVLLTWASLRLCDAATGTASCGGGPGLLMLLAILIVLTYLGGWLLRGFGISDAGSTSVLAVGLLAVVAMLFLVDSLDAWTGVVAVPLVTLAAYALSWRVTATLVEAGRA